MEREVPVLLRGEGHPDPFGFPDRDARVPGPELVLSLAVGGQAKRRAVEHACSLGVARRDRDEVKATDHRELLSLGCPYSPANQVNTGPDPRARIRVAAGPFGGRLVRL